MKTTDVRDQFDGVTYYGSSNCNYIVFPDGTLIENFGYHGRSLMNRIRENGVDATLNEIKEKRAEMHRVTGELCQAIRGLTESLVASETSD